MSDKPDEGGWHGSNTGITLPQDPKATHNLGLSPFFISRSGSNDFTNDFYTFNIFNRGRCEFLWSSTAIDDTHSYYLDSSNYRSFPSAHDYLFYPFSLRCLVSTANSLIIKRNLVSDKEATNAYDANIGTTLPNGVGATNNAALSPLFFSRVGTSSETLLYRGGMGRWYSPDAVWDSFAYYLSVYPDVTWPSSKDSRRQGYSLRCLVSTKRQASE